MLTAKLPWQWLTLKRTAFDRENGRFAWCLAWCSIINNLGGFSFLILGRTSAAITYKITDQEEYLHDLAPHN